MKVYWFAYRQLLFINIGISAALSFGSGVSFPFVFATFGFICTMYLYQYFYKNAWYIFFNIGYTKTSILIGTFFINLFIAIALSLILWIL